MREALPSWQADKDDSSPSLPDTTVGVFHLRSPLGQYKLTFNKAREACANEAATMATYNQLSYAQKVGPQLVGTVQAGSSGEGVQLLLNCYLLGGEPRELLDQYRFVTSIGQLLRVRHGAGASLASLSILITALEVGVPIAILQIGKPRL